MYLSNSCKVRKVVLKRNGVQSSLLMPAFSLNGWRATPMRMSQAYTSIMHLIYINLCRRDIDTFDTYHAKMVDTRYTWIKSSYILLCQIISRLLLYRTIDLFSSLCSGFSPNLDVLQHCCLHVFRVCVTYNSWRLPPTRGSTHGMTTAHAHKQVHGNFCPDSCQPEYTRYDISGSITHQRYQASEGGMWRVGSCEDTSNDVGGWLLCECHS